MVQKDFDDMSLEESFRSRVDALQDFNKSELLVFLTSGSDSHIAVHLCNRS